MNKNTAITEISLRAVGLILLLLVVLMRGTDILPHFIPDDKLLYVAGLGAIMLGAAYYLRHKRINTEQEEEE